MKQLVKSETTVTFFSILIIFYLFFSPLYYNCAFAANQNTAVIAHYPIRAARYGQAMVIKTHISNPSTLQKVTLVLSVNGTVKRGKMVEITSAGVVPVTARVRSNAAVFSGPGTNYKKRATLRNGETVKVADIRNGFYKIISNNGVTGYMQASDASPLATGKVYGVSLPASLTSRESLTYQIEVTDIYGGTQMTEPNQVQLLTPEQVKNLRSNKTSTTTRSQVQANPPYAQQQGEPVYKKGWFWLTLAALGGGTYFMLSQDQNDSDTGTLDVLVEWE